MLMIMDKDYFDLQGKAAIVTGAGGNIGSVIAKAFARRGVKVVAADIAKDKVDVVVDEIRNSGGEALAVYADITKVQQVDEMVRTALDKFGGIDILAGVAG